MTRDRRLLHDALETLHLVCRSRLDCSMLIEIKGRTTSMAPNASSMGICTRWNVLYIIGMLGYRPSYCLELRLIPGISSVACDPFLGPHPVRVYFWR